MPSGRDWVDLVRSTSRSVGRDDLAGLYAHEWQRAKANLIADHRESIESEKERVRRFLRTTNAVLFGLARRLAPARRVLLGMVLLCILFSLEGPSVHRSTERLSAAVRRTVEYRFHFDNLFLIVALVLLVLLLAMELVDKINYRDELELARDLQSSLIPRTLPRLSAWDLGAYNRSANTVGGDIYDFVPLPDGRLAVLFGDASGHGMAAGLVMAVAHAAFRTQLEVDPRPQAMVALLNRILCRTGGPRAFFGCVYLLLSPDGAFSGSVAGHPPVLRTGPDGEIRARCGRGAYPLGIKAPLAWEAETGRLETGEALLLHSDGLSEARDAQGTEFGDARIESGIRRAAGRSAPELVSELAREMSEFCGGAAPEDDVSIAAIRFLA